MPADAFHSSAVASIERVEVSIAAAAEQEIGIRGEDAGVGDIGHLEFPLSLAGLRVDGANGAVAFIFTTRQNRRRLHQ